MKFLILGGTGILGSDLVQRLSREAEVVAPGRQQLNVLDERSVHEGFESIQPDWVINATAYTQVDLAETEREAAEALNFRAVQRLIQHCHRKQIPFVHFSTDQVFDGTLSDAYREQDVPNPVNVYAKTKWEGEKSALEYPRSLVLRVQWLYGKKKDRFTLLKDKTQFSPFLDQIGCPTPTHWIAGVVADLIQRSANGLYHVTLDNSASWADVFAFVKRQLRLGVLLEPKFTDEVNLPAKRPLNCVLSNEKLKHTLGVSSFGKWEDYLGNFLAGHE